MAQEESARSIAVNARSSFAKMPDGGGLGRLYVELTSGVLEELRRELADRGVSVQEIWWGNNALQIVDPDGSELLFPISEGAALTGTAG
jgi:hypothetical protein